MYYMITLVCIVFSLHAMEQQSYNQTYQHRQIWWHRAVTCGRDLTRFCVSTGLPLLVSGSFENHTTNSTTYDPIIERNILIGVASLVGLSCVVGIGNYVAQKCCCNEPEKNTNNNKARRISARQHSNVKTAPNIEDYGEVELPQDQHKDIDLTRALAEVGCSPRQAGMGDAIEREKLLP